MSDWNQCKHYAGFDWASRSHQVVIVDTHGQIVANFSFENSAAGWELWHQKAKAFAPLAVCVETYEGVLVERLLHTEGCAVYSINPQAGKAYCTRKAPSGVKTDFRDSWAFADALRVDGHGWMRLLPTDPLVAELRMLCRDEMALIEERTALINQTADRSERILPRGIESFRGLDSSLLLELRAALPNSVRSG